VSDKKQITIRSHIELDIKRDAEGALTRYRALWTGKKSVAAIFEDLFSELAALTENSSFATARNGEVGCHAPVICSNAHVLAFMPRSEHGASEASTAPEAV